MFGKILGLIAVFCGVLPAQSESTNASPAASVLSVEGTVEVHPVAQAEWHAAAIGQSLEIGDALRTGPRSRATLRLSNLSVLRISERMSYEIEPPRTGGARPTLNLKSGSAYFFSRDKPQEVQIRTPSVTGAIRGTEFNVDVGPDGRTVVTMVEGVVELSNADGTATLGAGEQGVAEVGKAPVKTAVLNAVNRVQWNLYYPGVLEVAELDFTVQETSLLASSLAAYRAGDLLAALKQYPAGHRPDSASDHLFMGSLLLSVGLVEESLPHLDAATANGGQSARLANALRRLIAAVKFDVAEPGTAPILATELLAESYYQQSRGNLMAALQAASRATKEWPESGFAWERCAELEFSFGHTDAAQAALTKSLVLAPRNAQAVALNGFLLAAKNQMAAAQDEFGRAIGLDGALGNAWLGRGLCKIRRGQAEAGREDLQVAAALEPNRAVLRSYLGKAFSETRDNARAGHELELARKFDANDPTSWLYTALLHAQENRVNEAVRDLEQAQSLNDNRAVYRSRMLLDQDAAVAGANLANIYRDAGMSDVSVREATRAVNLDYANASAHLFLANSYNQLRDPNQINLRYETPWLSEYLLANLLAPVGAGTLSQTVSAQEYSKLFQRDGMGLASSTEYLSRGDWIQSGSDYGTYGNFGYAVDTLYRSENGQRPNNDQEQLTVSAQMKWDVTPQDSLFFQTIYYNASAGDLNQYYDPQSAHLALRTKETQEPLLLLGYRHEWSPGVKTLALFGRFDDTLTVTDTNQPVVLLARNLAGSIIAAPAGALPTASLGYESRLEIYSAEVQQLWQQEQHAVVLGARAQFGDFNTGSALGASTPTRLANTTTTSIVSFATSPISQSAAADFERLSGYGYYYWQPWEPLQLSAGISYDYLQKPINYRSSPITAGERLEDQVSPKAGLTWMPRSDTTLRFAYTRSLGGVSFDQSVRLEPSQVAGFNQAFRSIIPEAVAGSTSGAKFETFGLALERKFQTGTYLGVEGQILNSGVNQDIGVVFLNFPPSYTPGTTRQQFDYQERDLMVTANQLLGDCWSLGARYQLSQVELHTRYPDIPGSVTSANLTQSEATLGVLTLSALFNHPGGFFSRVDGNWYVQDNGGNMAALADENFWQVNVFAGYRFYRRHAQVQVGVLNLADQDYRLNPLNLYSTLARERTFTASFQFNF